MRSSRTQQQSSGLRLGERYVRLTAADKHEIIRLVEGSDLSLRRTLRELGVHRSTCYACSRRYQDRGAAGLSPRSSAAARRHWHRNPAADPAPRRGGRAGRSGTVAPRAGVAVHGPGAALSLGVQRVSHPQGRGSHHQSGICGALGGQDVCSADAPAQRVVAHRLHLPVGRRVGLVLPVHRTRRSLALHPGVDAADGDAGVGRHRHARPCPGPGRGGTECGSSIGRACSAITPLLHLAGAGGLPGHARPDASLPAKIDETRSLPEISVEGGEVSGS